MLIFSALSIFIAITIGCAMVFRILTKKPVTVWHKIAHVGMVAVGALLAVIAAFQTGDMRLWANIALSILVVILGIFVGLKKFRGKTGWFVLVLHAVLATICYLILLFNTFAIYSFY